MTAQLVTGIGELWTADPGLDAGLQRRFVVVFYLPRFAVHNAGKQAVHRVYHSARAAEIMV